MRLYFDSSALTKLLLEESGSTWTHECWKDFKDRITSRVAYVEVRSALAAAHRAKRIDDPELVLARRVFEEIWSRIDVIECEQILIEEAGDVAEARALRGFDAVHLASALQARSADTTVCMLTWDNELASATYESGISVIRTTGA